MPKHKVLIVNAQLLVDMCKPGARAFEVVEGLPEDASVVDIMVERRILHPPSFEVVIYSETYADAGMNRLPLVDVSFRKLTVVSED